MVTTSSSATRGSTTNINSYVRMGAEYLPMAWFGPAPRAEQRGVGGQRGEATPPVRSDIFYMGAGKRQGAGEQALTPGPSPGPPTRPPGEGREARRRRLPDGAAGSLGDRNSASYRVPPPWAGGGWGWGEDRRGVRRRCRGRSAAALPAHRRLRGRVRPCEPAASAL